ncbi:hypothetical protein [Polyangium sp. y55x31]|nr:hypothetical protein [Polyangium sp. y55x31]MDI1476581.1 hypothetical protein [Polyangium sp. y55x31]
MDPRRTQCSFVDGGEGFSGEVRDETVVFSGLVARTVSPKISL